MSEHRLFHYDLDSGRSTPVKEVRLADGTIALVPIEIEVEEEITKEEVKEEE